MRILGTAGRVIYATGAIALLGGCAGGSSPAPVGATSTEQSRALHAIFAARAEHPELTALPGVRARRVLGMPSIHVDGGSTVWVTDAGNNEVFECIGDCKATGSLGPETGTWDEPQGIAADAKGNVYVADTLNSRIVELSKKGAQVAILSDPGEYPAGVGVAKDGTVGVTNIVSASGGDGDIVFYAPGATSPTSTATGLLANYYFGGFDNAGNFYNDGVDSNGAAHVAVVAAGGTTDVDTGITGLVFPGGVQISKLHRSLNVVDQSCPCIRAYKLGKGYPLLETIALGGASDPVSFGFVRADKALWIADAGAQLADEYAYPAGGSPIASLGAGIFSEPIGAVAVPYGQF